MSVCNHGLEIDNCRAEALPAKPSYIGTARAHSSYDIASALGDELDIAQWTASRIDSTHASQVARSIPCDWMQICINAGKSIACLPSQAAEEAPCSC